MKRLLHGCIAFTILLIFSCRNTPQVNPESEMQDLLEADKNLSEAYRTQDIYTIIDFYDKDGLVIEPNGLTHRGITEIRKYWTGFFMNPDVSLVWVSIDVLVSKSGDLGYTTGSWSYKWTTETGEPMDGYGTYLIVWKKHDDGTWKVRVFSS